METNTIPENSFLSAVLKIQPDHYIEPADEILSTDTVIGVMTEFEKQLWTYFFTQRKALLTRLRSRVQEFDIVPLEGHEEEMLSHQDTSAFDLLMNLIRERFFSEVDRCMDFLCLRKNYTIVLRKQEPGEGGYVMYHQMAVDDEQFKKFGV